MQLTIRRLRSLIREALDRAPGYWITQTGDVVPVKDGELHDQVAAKILGMNVDRESDDNMPDAADTLEMNGGIRIREIEPHVLTITMFNLRKSELRRLQDGLTTIAYPMVTRVKLMPNSRNDVIHTTVEQLMLANDPREL